MRIAIVEDEKKYEEELRRMIFQYGLENGISMEVVSFPDGKAFLDWYEPKWDLIFLDIVMPRMNGMRAAEKLRQIDEDVLLIFITSMAKYAIKGYEVDALDFMLKPVNYYAFCMKMRKVCRILGQDSKSSVLLPCDGSTIKVPIAEICYVEVADHQLIYHTTTNTYHSFGTLKEAAQTLGRNFARCNHCYLVNLKYVDGIRNEYVLVHGEELKVSRTRKKEFVDQLSNYYREG